MILCDNEQNQFCTKIDSTFFLTIWRLIGDRSPVRKTGRKGRFLAPGSLGNIQSLSVRKTGRISLITYWTNHMVDHMEYVLQYSYQALKISDSYKIIRSFHKLSFFIINVNNRTSKRVSRKKSFFFQLKDFGKKNCLIWVGYNSKKKLFNDWFSCVSDLYRWSRSVYGLLVLPLSVQSWSGRFRHEFIGIIIFPFFFIWGKVGFEIWPKIIMRGEYDNIMIKNVNYDKTEKKLLFWGRYIFFLRIGAL